MAKLTNTPRASLGLELERRKSFMLQVTVLNNDGTAMDLTGCTMRFVLKDTHYDDDNLDLNNLLVNNEASITAPLTGVAVFAFQAAELDEEPGEYYGTIVLWTPDGYSLVLLKPTVQLLENNESASMGLEYVLANPPDAVEVTLRGVQVVNLTTASARPSVPQRGPCTRLVNHALAPAINGTQVVPIADLYPVQYPNGLPVEVQLGDIVFVAGTDLLAGVVVAKTDTTATIQTKITG